MKLNCGKESCAMCESCVYDQPLDAPLLKIKNNMKNFGVVSVDGNPSTAQIILLGSNNAQRQPPVSDPIQLGLPFMENKKSKPLCNGCDFLRKIPRPGQSTYNCRCMLNMVGSKVTEKVIKLKVYPDEKIETPSWCRKLNTGGKQSVIPYQPQYASCQLALPARVNSPLSEEQRRRWDEAKERNRIMDIWAGASGITSWGEIQPGKVYHLPPTPKHGRMNLIIERVYPDSIFCHNVKTRDNVWLYKEDEEYKFLSEVEQSNG